MLLQPTHSTLLKSIWIKISFNTASGKCCCNLNLKQRLLVGLSFNTASGKCCCNLEIFLFQHPYRINWVSIPQAVSAVATYKIFNIIRFIFTLRFNTASGKCCCNCRCYRNKILRIISCFNTASGKCCCNLRL